MNKSTTAVRYQPTSTGSTATASCNPMPDPCDCPICRGDLGVLRVLYYQEYGVYPTRDEIRQFRARHQKRRARRLQAPKTEKLDVADLSTRKADAEALEAYKQRKRARREHLAQHDQAKQQSLDPATESENIMAKTLDREDALRFVVAEAKKLKEENTSLYNKLGELRIYAETTDKKVTEHLGTIKRLERELKEALELATAPKTVEVEDSLAQDLSFFGLSRQQQVAPSLLTERSPSRPLQNSFSSTVNAFKNSGASFIKQWLTLSTWTDCPTGKLLIYA